MSFLSNLFNRKRQNADLHTHIEKEDFFENEAEDAKNSYGKEKDNVKKSASLSENQEVEMIYEVVEREIHPAKIICPDCGGITLEGLDFCDKCGGELL